MTLHLVTSTIDLTLNLDAAVAVGIATSLLRAIVDRRRLPMPGAR